MVRKTRFIIGYTPLHAAVTQLNPALVTLLLRHGANPEIRSFIPRTAKEIKDQMPPKEDKTPLELAQTLTALIPATQQEDITNIEHTLQEAVQKRGIQPQLQGEASAQEAPVKKHKGDLSNQS